jgi:hypothetical protein
MQSIIKKNLMNVHFCDAFSICCNCSACDGAMVIDGLLLALKKRRNSYGTFLAMWN